MCLAFASRIAGHGMVISTLGAVLGRYAAASNNATTAVPIADSSHNGTTAAITPIAYYNNNTVAGSAAIEGEEAAAAAAAAAAGTVLELGGGIVVAVTTVNGLLLCMRWIIEGLGAPLYGRLLDRCGWRVVAPVAFGASSLNGILTYALLRAAGTPRDSDDGGGGGGSGSGVLLASILLAVLSFFTLVSAADLCVRAMGVAWRETTLLVQGADLGAALGPIVGWYILEHGGAENVFLAQALLHGAGAALAGGTAYATRWSTDQGGVDPYRVGGKRGGGNGSKAQYSVVRPDECDEDDGEHEEEGKEGKERGNEEENDHKQEVGKQKEAMDSS